MPILLEQVLANLMAGDLNDALPGTGSSQPGGLECTFYYNGVTLHDRRYVDKIRVTKIDGLHDSDIRDNREVLPADHGEIPLSAFYGGKNITIEGKIEAYNVNKLRDMQQGFRYAFSSLSENYLYILKASGVSYGAEDIRIACRKIAPIQMTEEQKDITFFRDFQLNLRASKPFFESANEHVETVNFGLLDEFSSNTIGASNYSIYTGSGMYVSGGSLFATTSSTNQIVASNMGYNPFDLQQTIKYTTTATVSNFSFGHTLRTLSATINLYAKLNAFGASSYIQLYANNASTITLLNTSSTFSLSASTSYWFMAYASGNSFMAGQWNVDPFNVSTPPITSVSTTLTGVDAVNLGSGIKGGCGLRFDNVMYDMPFDNFRVEPLNLNHQVITINNTGNFNAKPKVRLHGPMYNTTITNEVFLHGESSYRSFTIDGAINASTYYEYDISQGTLRDVDGNNVFSQFNVSSKDVILQPGDNFLAITSASTFASPRMDVYYRNTWI